MSNSFTSLDQIKVGHQFDVEEHKDHGSLMPWALIDITTRFQGSKVIDETEEVRGYFHSKEAATKAAEDLDTLEAGRVARYNAIRKSLAAKEAAGVEFTLPTGSRVTTEPHTEVPVIDPQLQKIKSELYKALKLISGSNDWQYWNQPWLHRQQTHARTDTEAKKKGQRVGQNGKRRNVGISDLGGVLDCPRSFAATYAAVPVKVRNDEVLYRGKSGTKFGAAFEEMFPIGWITETSESRREGFNRTMVHLPSIGNETTKEVTGNKRDGINGFFDAYIPHLDAGVEIKSVALGDKLPDELPSRAFGQAASYAHGMRFDTYSPFRPTYWCWVYMPQDLSQFNPEDITTYRVFFRSADELETEFQKVWAKVKEVADLVDMLGYESAVKKLTCPKEGTGQHCDFCHVNWLGASTTTNAGQTLQGAGR